MDENLKLFRLHHHHRLSMYNSKRATAAAAEEAATPTTSTITNIIFNCQIKPKRIYGCKLILIFVVGIGKVFAKSFVESSKSV